MQDSDLKRALIAASTANPPGTYVINRTRPVSWLLCELFPRNSTIGKIMMEALTEDREGVIVFGYPDNRSMKPITDILDKIPGLNYASIDVAGGRKLYLMSHWGAREHLPMPWEIGQGMSVVRSRFDEELYEALSAMKSQATPRHRINTKSDETVLRR